MKDKAMNNLQRLSQRGVDNTHLVIEVPTIQCTAKKEIWKIIYNTKQPRKHNYKRSNFGECSVYEISNYGRFKRNGKISKQHLTSSGYYEVWLNGYRFSTHKLVALLFIPNPHGKPCINHKDEDKTNNHYTNLEWATYQENSLHNDINKRCAMKSIAKRIASGRTQAIYSVDMYTGDEKLHYSLRECARHCKTQPQHIRAYLNGKRHSVKGYIFHKADLDKDIVLESYESNFRLDEESHS